MFTIIDLICNLFIIIYIYFLTSTGHKPSTPVTSDASQTTDSISQAKQKSATDSVQETLNVSSFLYLIFPQNATYHKMSSLYNKKINRKLNHTGLQSKIVCQYIAVLFSLDLMSVSNFVNSGSEFFTTARLPFSFAYSAPCSLTLT